ncbi:hypothetical protein [Streptomyces sioyaensis]|uniref:hypothetical protein n=1 Tax=Streptomyces sioyaensis TaxID=67364 RepID=UPI00379D436E
MTFDVRPEDLEGFGRQVGRAAQDAEQGKDYIHKFGDMGTFGGQGLILWMTDLHPQAMDSVDSVLKRMSSLLDASAKELHKSAGFYRQTDHDQAAKMDGTYPASKR